MPKEKSTNDIALKLRKLWKGTIYIGITGVYVLLLGMVLVFTGLRPALLTFFLIALVQLFRYIAGDVDRLGWVMDNKEVSGDQEDARSYQSKMLLLLFSIIQISNLAIVYQTYQISTGSWACLAFIGIFAIELMFMKIRKINHEIDYELASYGLKDSSPICHGVNAQDFNESKLTKENEEIDKKLETLKLMVEKGELTQKAYEEVRDQQLIKRIMNK
ncbi:MAG: hypothetical protein QF552_10765 [Litorilituus sp.]|nr:hypothetical protein [Litorilituus sp.]